MDKITWVPVYINVKKYDRNFKNLAPQRKNNIKILWSRVKHWLRLSLR